LSRLRHRRAPLTPGDPLVTLLEDMHDLRMTLAADLTAAAGAADAGADDVARDIIEADRVELARFARVANIRLERLEHPLPEQAEPRPEPRPAWRRRLAVALPVAPVVGAMALSAAAATGVLPIPGSTHAPKQAVVRADDPSPVSSFKQLVSVLNNDHSSASQVMAAASKLHRQLRQLIANSPNDPGKTAEIAQLLSMEQSLLLQKQPPGVSVILDATRKLAARLVTVAPEVASPSIAPTFVPTAPHHTHKSQHHDASPSPSARPTPPQPAQPTPATSANPSPSPSPSNGPFTLPQ
jgi:hypothetical protein